jgi:fatty acid desaturase
MLKNWRDLQSILYLISLPVFIAYIWHKELRTYLDYVLYSLIYFLSVGISAVHHNHAHVSMWHSKFLNRLTNWYLGCLQGHPTFVFYASHNANHHRYHHGEKDVTRTYRFGDTNHLWGYLIHPLQAIIVLYPLFIQWLVRIYNRERRVFYYFLMQYLLVLLMWSVFASIDVEKFIVLILLPQLFGLHWLLATNYLQHAHANGHSRTDFARNFSGWVNFLHFNIGLHTAHHLYPREHWSRLPLIHAKLKQDIHPQLLEGGLASYMLRTYIFSLFFSRFRSHSLMVQTKTNSTTKDHLCP